PWTAAGSLRAMRVVTDAGSMGRRILLTLLGAAACTPAHEWLIAHPDTGVARASGSPLPIGVVDHLDDIAGQLRLMDDQLGGETLLPLVRANLRHVLGLLDQRRYTEAVGRRLHATAAELMRLAGWSAMDGGQHPQAQRYWLDEAHAHAFAGYCYLHLRDCARARQHLRTALHLWYPSYARDSALHHIYLATTYLHQDQPEVDHAVTLATRAVQTLTGEVDSTYGVGHLTRLIGDLTPYR
ncbi:MAG: hypothetical protein ACRDQX_05380, partial [Pseudonocardiaceae bacterium]